MDYKHHRDLTDIEKSLIDDLRAKIKDQVDAVHHSHAGKDVGELLRFLKAREFNVEKAFHMYHAHLKWRAEFQPEKITAEDVANELKKEKFVQVPPGKDGRACLVFFAAKHLPGEIPMEETVKYVVFMLERTIASLPEGQEKIIFVYDRTDFARKNFDNSLISQVANLLEANYPERVGNILILKPNWLFHVLYAIAKPFIPSETVKKIKLIDGDLKPTMLEYFDEDNLWSRYGGKYEGEGIDNSPFLAGDDKKDKKEKKDKKDSGKDKKKSKKTKIVDVTKEDTILS